MSLLPSPRRQFLYFLICGLFLLVSVAGGAILALVATIPYWPTVQAQVIASAVRTITMSGEGDVYLPQIIYTYQAAGVEYASGCVRIGDKNFKDERAARRYCDARPVGSAIAARYFPLCPQVAVLETGASNGPWMMTLVAGLAFVGFRLVAGFQEAQK